MSDSRRPESKCEPLPASSLAERFLYCAGMLHLAGMLSDGERRKVHERMMKWKRRHNKTEVK